MADEPAPPAVFAAAERLIPGDPDPDLAAELANAVHRMAVNQDSAQCRDSHLRAVVSRALSRLDDDPGVVFILFCKTCDPDLNNPALHPNSADRGRWASGHKRATGHDSWLVLDWDTPVEAARNAHYVSTYCIDATGNPDLHTACRGTCMHCAAPCRCSCHTARETP